MNEQSVILSIRLPPSTRDNFYAAMKDIGKTPTEYIRDIIKNVIKDRIPVPQRIDYVELATSYTEGKIPSIPIMHLINESSIPLIKEIEKLKNEIPEHHISEDRINKSLAAALHEISMEFVKLHRKHEEFKKAIELAQKLIDDENK